MKQNALYQKLIEEMNKKDLSYEWMDNFGQMDLQLQETMHIIKDLVFFLGEEIRQQKIPLALGQ